MTVFSSRIRRATDGTSASEYLVIAIVVGGAVFWGMSALGTAEGDAIAEDSNGGAPVTVAVAAASMDAPTRSPDGELSPIDRDRLDLRALMELNHPGAVTGEGPAYGALAASEREGWEQRMRAHPEDGEAAFAISHIDTYHGQLGSLTDMDLAVKRAEIRAHIDYTLAAANARHRDQMQQGGFVNAWTNLAERFINRSHLTRAERGGVEFLRGIDQALAGEQRVRRYEARVTQRLLVAKGGAEDAASSAVLARLGAARGLTVGRNPAFSQYQDSAALEARREQIRIAFAALEAQGHAFNADQRAQYHALAAEDLGLMREQLVRGEDVISPAAKLSPDVDRRINMSGELMLPLADFTYSSPFGERHDPMGGGEGFHPGVDLAAPAGTPIGAAMEGTVVSAQFDGDAGNCVTIEHPNGWRTRYMHMTDFAVTAGQTVTMGQTIGTVGTTGASTGPHLHLELKTDPNGGVVDAAPLLGLEPGQLGSSIHRS